MCEACKQEATMPANVVASNLAILGGLALRNQVDIRTRDDATRAVQTQVTRLVDEASAASARAERLQRELDEATRRAERYREQLTQARKDRQKAEVVASNTEAVATVVRDLTKVFTDEELWFEQTDEDGYVFRVTGYDALELSVDLYNYTVSVRNATKRRKARTYGFDPSGLSAEAFLALEALFQSVELTKGNTPSRVHDELFDEDVSDEGPSVTFGVMASSDCGNPDCPLHGENGLLKDTSEVPDVVRQLVESIAKSFGAGSVKVVPVGMGYNGYMTEV